VLLLCCLLRWYARHVRDGESADLRVTGDEVQEWHVEKPAPPTLRGPRQRAADAEKAAHDAGFGDTSTWVPVSRIAHRFVPCFFSPPKHPKLRLFRTCPLAAAVHF
jgi:hypothetical protein